MRDLLKKIGTYISRSWEDEATHPHPVMRLLPPFLWELLSYLILIGILYQIGAYLWRQI